MGKKYLIIIIPLLLSFLIATIIAKAANIAPLVTDKDTYEPDETVIINITLSQAEYQKYYFSLQSSTNGTATGNYTYKGEFNEVMFFYPTEEGIYTAALVDRLTGATFFSTSFYVNAIVPIIKAPQNVSAKDNALEMIASAGGLSGSDALPDQTVGADATSDASTNSEALFYLEKSQYYTGERIRLIKNPDSNFSTESLRLYISFNGTVKRYMGELSTVDFEITQEGQYELLLTDAANQMVRSYPFTVLKSNTTFQNNSAKQEHGGLVQIRNSKGLSESGLVRVFDSNNQLIDSFNTSVNGGLPDASNFSSGNIEITPAASKSVKRILLKNVRSKDAINPLSIGFEDVPYASLRKMGKNTLKTFAIDPTGINFTEGILTGIAAGTELWKCRDWDFLGQQCLGDWIKIRNLTPGQEYEVNFTQADPGYAETGLATINTKRPIYHPGENAEIIIVTLDTLGHLVSNANVQLIITTPDNRSSILSTNDDSILEASTGIYETTFQDTEQEGNYTLEVIAQNDLEGAEGAYVNNTMISFFTVSPYYQFDILRDNPITTDPWQGPFTSSIQIISHTNDEIFNFTEIVPIEFEITTSGGAAISTYDNRTYLTWNDMQNNSMISYSARPPRITPELYQLGPSYVSYGSGIFYEARPWFLAVDPVSISADLEAGTKRYNANDTQTEFFYEPANAINAAIWNNTDDGDWASSNTNPCNVTSFRDVLTGLSILQTKTAGINTSGYGGIILRFNASVNALDAGEYLNASWYNGVTWTDVYTRNANLACGPQILNLGGGADDNDNFQMRFACNHNAGLNERCIVDDIRLLGTPITADVNKTPNNYTNIVINNLLNPLLNITVIVNVTYYNNSGSVVAGNTNASLGISLNNGTGWAYIGKLNINGTGNFSITTNDAGVLSAWLTQSNRNLSIKGVYMDYAGSTSFDQINYTGVWVTVRYSAPPTVNINTSLDDLFTNDATPNVDFNFTSDDSLTANCTLYIDNISYGSNISTTNNTRTSITATSTLGDGNHSIYVNCTGIYNNIGNSSKINIVVDTAPPTVNAIIPANDNNTNRSRPNFFFNYTDGLSSSASCTLYIGSTSYGSNASVHNYTQTNISAGSVVPNGQYLWNVSCVDLAGNVGGSVGRNITVDTGVPVVNSLVPANNNFTSVVSPNFFFNFTDGLSDSANCSLFVDSVNQGHNDSVLNNTLSNITLGVALSQGRHLWNVTCIDLASNYAWGLVRSITVDTSVPVVNPLVPANNNITKNNSPLFTFNYTDNLGPNASCSLFIGSTVYATNSSVLNYTRTNITAGSVVPDGLYLWNVTCTDLAGNSAGSAGRNITIDSTQPTVNLLIPSNNNFTSIVSPNFFFNFTDGLSSSANCSLYIDSVSRGNNNSVSNNTLTNLTIGVALSQGRHMWNVTCVDIAGNGGNSVVSNITIDTAVPTVNSLGPANNNQTNNNTPMFTFNFTDNLSPNASCTLYIGDVSYGVNASTLNNTQTNITAGSPVPDGQYLWNVTCFDLAGNVAGSLPKNITIDTSIPTINSLIPANDNFTNNTRPNFFFNYTDTLSNTANCTLFIGTSMYGTNSSTLNNTLTNITANASVPNGRYLWNVTCTDIAGNAAGSLGRNITVDTSIPTVNPLAPANNNLTNISTPTFSFNYTDGLSPTSNCSLYIGTAIYGNNATTINNTITYITASPEIPEGQNLWNITCRDLAGNIAGSTPRSITVDVSAPNTSIDLPANDSIIDVRSVGLSFMVNATVADFGTVQKVVFLYRVNSTDSWKPICNDTDPAPYNCSWDISGLKNGRDYEVRAYSIDSFNNIGQNNTHVNITMITEVINFTTVTVDDNTTLPVDEIDLSAGLTKEVHCNMTVNDPADYTHIKGVNATFYSNTTVSEASDDNRTHYSNQSCSFIAGGGPSADYFCNFQVLYYAINGSWLCTGFAWDDYTTGTKSHNVTVGQLFALNVSTVEINYSSLQPAQTSSEIAVNITNLGNMPMNISVFGFGGDNETLGSNLSMVCGLNNISINFQKFSLQSSAYGSKTNLSSGPKDLGLTIQPQISSDEQKINTTYWQLMVPPTAYARGECNGSVVFMASSP